MSYGSSGSESLEGFEDHEIEVAREMLEIVRMRERGEVPAHYTAITTCKQCGPVPIFEGAGPHVLGCPWCFNRLQGLPMPKVPS